MTNKMQPTTQKTESTNFSVGFWNSSPKYMFNLSIYVHYCQSVRRWMEWKMKQKKNKLYYYSLEMTSVLSLKVKNMPRFDMREIDMPVSNVHEMRSAQFDSFPMGMRYTIYIKKIKKTLYSTINGIVYVYAQFNQVTKLSNGLLSYCNCIQSMHVVRYCEMHNC